MQVPPVPAPIVPSALPPETVAKTVAHVQTQVATPQMLQRAVPQAPRSESGHQTRSNADKAKGGPGTTGKRGGSVNIRV